MQIQTLTFEQLIGTVAVILILIGAYNTVMSALKTRREEKKRREQPVSDLETKVNAHEEKLKHDHDRLNSLEESNRILMRAMMALMSHELNGNSDEKMKASYDEIQKYLIER